MTLSNCQVRRATIDDLVVLRRLWQQAGLAPLGLEKRLREFQVVETAAGELLGAIGLQIDQEQGKIHSESYLDLGDADQLRPRLWERLQTIARNYGLVRLWIRHGTAMFWLEKGFEAAESSLKEKLPAGLSEPQSEEWLTLKLREDVLSSLTVEQELEMFRQSQLEQAAKVRQQARVLRMLAGVVVVVLGFLIMGALWYGMRFLKRR